jgi:hypothetical protein
MDIKYLLTNDELNLIITGLDPGYVGIEIFDRLCEARDACTQGIALMPYEAVRGEIIYADAKVHSTIYGADAVEVCPVLRNPYHPDVLYAETSIGNMVVERTTRAPKHFKIVLRDGLPVMQGLGVHLVGDGEDDS